MALQHVKGDAAVAVDGDLNLTSVLWERAEAGDTTQILKHYSDGSWRGMTWKQFADRVREVAGGLIALGVQKGDRVALMSGTRMEWTIADLAILAAGGVTVPIYETSSVDQCEWILSDSGAKAAVAETADHAKKLEQARSQAPDLGEIFVIDDAGLDALAERGDDGTRGQVAQRAAEPVGTDLATIVYTSGTTGNPKGCMLTHSNLKWISVQSETNLRKMLGDDDSTLMFLPLAHSFARLVQFLCLEANVTIGYARSVETLVEDLQSFSPTFLLAVPRVFEKVFNTAQRKAEGPKAKVFDFAVSTAGEWSGSSNPGLLTNLKRTVADKLVYGKLRDAIGGRVRYCVSGGAPLAPHIAHFFNAANITILEGYGLTETSAPATVNTPEKNKIGTVGRPLPGCEVKIAEDGEILIKGGNIFDGYWHNEEASNEVLEDDGWFHSGDIGEIDNDGFVKITGRKKELIVTAGGKNVAPAVLEERMKSHRLISQVMVVGDNKPFIAAMVTLDPDELTAYAKDNSLSGSPAELATNEAIRSEVQKAVDHANKAVSKAESIRKFTVLDRDFTMEDNELTPSMKLRRRNVMENFADDFEALYTK